MKIYKNIILLFGIIFVRNASADTSFWLTTNETFNEYWFSTFTGTFSAAHKVCTRLQSTLASLSSNAEWEFVTNLAINLTFDDTYPSFYVNGKWNFTSRDFYWIDKSVFPGAARWGPFQPTSRAGIQNCVSLQYQIYRYWIFDDFCNNETFRFICQRKKGGNYSSADEFLQSISKEIEHSTEQAFEGSYTSLSELQITKTQQTDQNRERSYTSLSELQITKTQQTVQNREIVFNKQPNKTNRDLLYGLSIGVPSILLLTGIILLVIFMRRRQRNNSEDISTGKRALQFPPNYNGGKNFKDCDKDNNPPVTRLLNIYECDSRLSSSELSPGNETRSQSVDDAYVEVSFAMDEMTSVPKSYPSKSNFVNVDEEVLEGYNAMELFSEAKSSSKFFDDNHQVLNKSNQDNSAKQRQSFDTEYITITDIKAKDSRYEKVNTKAENPTRSSQIYDALSY